MVNFTLVVNWTLSKFYIKVISKGLHIIIISFEILILWKYSFENEVISYFHVGYRWKDHTTLLSFGKFSKNFSTYKLLPDNFLVILLMYSKNSIESFFRNVIRFQYIAIYKNNLSWVVKRIWVITKRNELLITFLKGFPLTIKSHTIPIPPSTDQVNK